MTEKKQLRPYGFWDSQFQPSSLSQELRLNDVQWTTDGRCLVWLEGRSDRGVLVCQDPPSTAQRDLTRELSVRAGVGYGGGEFSTGQDSVYFVSGGVLYHQPLHGSPPSPVTPAWGDVASAVPSPDERFLLYVHSSGGKDVLALVDIAARDWPQRLVQGHDFYMQPCWHPSGEEITWVCWNHPNMPWDGTAIMRGRLRSDQRGAILVETRIEAGDPNGTVAFFQPHFSPDGALLAYVSDESGWFNLRVVSSATGECVAQVTEEAEHAPPAWVQGLRSFDWTADGSHIYFIRSRHSVDRLARLEISSGRVDEVEGKLVQQYTALYQPAVSSATGEVALLASAPSIPIRVITVDSQGKVTIRRRSSPEILSTNHFSTPEALSWETEGGEKCYGLFYPPRNPRFSSSGVPPLLIKIHGGPTSQYRVEYDPETQFFTSRGYAVLAL
ncbi:MAG TPA: hypothetical protein VKZ59_14990, partial [Acidobacteriota bacterium]|nr:hypothetical protein [Acidobacteriota bacterium]